MAKISASDLHNALVDAGVDVTSVRLKGEEYSVVIKSGSQAQADAALQKAVADLSYKAARQEELAKLQVNDQIDAIYKGVSSVVGLLKKLGASDKDLSDAGLVPDKSQPLDTPAGWLGYIQDVKEKNPKPKA